jgi:hypothetical protein
MTLQPLHLNFLTYQENLIFFFISVATHINSNTAHKNILPPSTGLLHTPPSTSAKYITTMQALSAAAPNPNSYLPAPLPSPLDKKLSLSTSPPPYTEKPKFLPVFNSHQFTALYECHPSSREVERIKTQNV